MRQRELPFAQGEEDGSAGVIEGVPHDGVSSLWGDVVVVAVVVLEVIDTPAGVGVRVVGLISQGSGTSDYKINI